MSYIELLQKAKTLQEVYKRRGEEKTLEFCLLNLIFEERIYFDDSVKNALLQEMASMILDFRRGDVVDYLEDNIAEYHYDLLEEED